MISLLEKTRIHRVLGASASGTSTLTTTALDVTGGGSAVTFLLEVSAVTGVSLQRQQSIDGSTWTDVGDAYAPVAADKPVALDYLDPDFSLGSKFRLEITRGSAAAVGPVYALEHGSRVTPVTQPTGTETGILTGSEV